MANEWKVAVPDRSTPYTFIERYTPEEIKAHLVANGHALLENASMEINGRNITFRRPSGGTKGL